MRAFTIAVRSDSLRAPPRDSRRVREESLTPMFL
jgi:hypothetical protein